MSLSDEENSSFLFIFLAFVSHMPNTKTRPNGTETDCNRLVRRSFLTSRFGAQYVKTEILGSMQKLSSTPTDPELITPLHKRNGKNGKEQQNFFGKTEGKRREMRKMKERERRIVFLHSI